MKLENKFFNSFFYPFLIGVILSSLIVTILVFFFTNSFYDKRMTQKIIDLETQYAKTNIKLANINVLTILLKVQASVNEQILFYQKMANKTKDKDITELTYNDDKFKVVYDFTEDFLKKNEKNLTYMGFWYIDDSIEHFDNITDNRIKKQIISFSYILHNLYSTSVTLATNNSIYKFYYYFEDTNLLFSFPISYDYSFGYLDIYRKFGHNTAWCTKENGDLYNIYVVRCRDFYKNIQKSKTDIFDNNSADNNNRTIFVTDFYSQLSGEENEKVYTVGIQFKDPVTNGTAYVFSDISQTDLVASLYELNSNLAGYFFITCVGFNKVFFFPQGYDYPKTSTSNIFKWDTSFIFEEKINFYSHIQKILTSNYINKILSISYEEIYLNGVDSNNQSFYLNNEKLQYSIFPVVLENLRGEKEHVLSIIYIYNTELYLSKFNSNNYSIIINIILELLLFIIFGFGIIYIIFLTFNILAKYIVIPIKNANYMLKGINIGGRNRLDYLDYLKKRQDDSLEKLGKMNSLDSKDNNDLYFDQKASYSSKEKDNNNNIDSKEKIGIENTEQDAIIDNKEKNKLYIDEKIYDKEIEYIEKENNFYDFDDSLLQYRSFEIGNLVNLLIGIKSAFKLTASDQTLEKIIDYSYSENIFRLFKNKDGASICQSNIGNLQIQLLKYDKAIYHLASSLQDNKLNKFFSHALSDELDETDSLIYKFSYFFNKALTKEKSNILMEKQQRNTSENFSQKIIGVLINTRYCRLIYAYYKFFKGLKKLEKISSNDIKGQFINANFHNINYYHKILIQYIYLSCVKNDLIKIGESILDYIEFFIEFKFKTSKAKKYLLNIKYRERLEYEQKQNQKRIIFDKIIKWFNLFEDYIFYVKGNTSLNDDKNIINEYSNDIDNKENFDANSNSQSSFLFKVNIQRADFLKGKFALCCKNYNDALIYFILSAKKKSIVSDGLIKKRSLKKIFIILIKMKKKFEKYGLMKLSLHEKNNLNSKDKEKHKLRKSTLIKKEENEEDNFRKNKTFYEEIKYINEGINKDINECNDKEAKDIIILIDFNIYTNTENNKTYNDIIDTFISQTKIILDDYLSPNDRFSLFIYKKQYYIICSLMHKYEVDIKIMSQDLDKYKEKILEEKEVKEYDINFQDFDNENKDFELGGIDFIANSQDEETLSENNNKIKKLYKEIEGLFGTINYIKNYYNMKKGIKNEKYIILFTDLFNANLSGDDNITKLFDKIKENKEVIILLVGKKKNNKGEIDKITNMNLEDKYSTKFFSNKFGDKSEIINLENMNKIKTILSYNKAIKDDIMYPNEIYK